MAKSRTTKKGGPPILGGLFGVKPHYETTISEGGKKRTGAGKTSEKSQKNASKKWEKSSGSGSGGGCFLTTACTGYHGLSDDCNELNILRNFRDRYLRSLPDGDVMIQQYYAVAPMIVERIEQESPSNRKAIYAAIYAVVQQAVMEISTRNYQKALSIYSDLFSKLKVRYCLKA